MGSGRRNRRRLPRKDEYEDRDATVDVLLPGAVVLPGLIERRDRREDATVGACIGVLMF